MSKIPMTAIEIKAEEATKLPALRVNLSKVRETVETALNEWRSSGFFHEYTDHSFNHVLDMLKAAEWLIPTETQEAMTPADWLMLVLSIYFHDIGLLVTKAEFEERDNDPDYRTYLNTPVLPSEKQRDYEARLAQMPLEEAAKLQYQEYVRLNHGKRVKQWIAGGGSDRSAIKLIVADLLRDLDDTFRRDLARVCESHTASNIDDTSIFKISQPYGGDEETVNLQYVAVVLRTIDLLQITRSRTPSILFQLINPSNPTSQLEWKKQGAVRNVRFRPARDRDGNVTMDVLPDTIEVHASFKDPDGFFGLTSYLTYAERELSQSYRTIQKSSKDNLRKYLFPWRTIDTSNIDTEGFLTDSFEFALDQHKILDLLTGHTLYNNSHVVLRELTQNALDAVRLQAQIETKKSTYKGEILIKWDSASRSLTVADNGTGMSQEMIVNHLLKVGSSRYQDPKFKEKYPSFHSISRFGIGVLSAFMVSDEIEITTCHPDDDEARRIALRSVHGKYLIKLLDKQADRDELPYPHGTSIKLNLRPTAEIGNVLRVARQWVMFPRCTVKVIIDDNEPVRIGYSSPKEAVQQYLDYSHRKSRFKKEHRIIEVERDGVTVAFAVAKDDLFEDWTFVDLTRRAHDEDEAAIPACICIEGVSVEEVSPGFSNINILAAANAVGKDAPKTNVARTSLEETPERHSMLKAIYGIYSDFVADELGRIAAADGVSLTRAVGMAPYLISPLTNATVPVTRPGLMDDAITTVPMVLVEDANQRSNISLDELISRGSFTTTESPLFRSVDQLIREAPSDVTSSQLLDLLGNQVSSDDAEIKLCNLGSLGWVDRKIKEKFEIREITVSIEHRELRLKWSLVGSKPAWFSSESVEDVIEDGDYKFASMYREIRERLRSGRNRSERICVPIEMLPVYGLVNEGAFISHRATHLKPGTDIVSLLNDTYANKELESHKSLAVYFMIIEYIRASGLDWKLVTLEDIERFLSMEQFSRLRPFFQDETKFTNALRSSPPGIFDAGAWDRRNAQWGII